MLNLKMVRLVYRRTHNPFISLRRVQQVNRGIQTVTKCLNEHFKTRNNLRYLSELCSTDQSSTCVVQA